MDTSSPHYKLRNRLAYAEYNEDIDDVDLRGYITRNTVNFCACPTRSLLALSAEIQLLILQYVAVNNMDIIHYSSIHVQHESCDRNSLKDPRYYISRHLFKSRLLCRRFARSGAEVFKKLVQESRYDHYRRIVIPNNLSSDFVSSVFESSMSHFKGFVLDGFEVCLYPEDVIVNADQTSLRLEDQTKAYRRLWEQHGRSRPEPTHFSPDEIEAFRYKLQVFADRQLDYAKWLTSADAKPTFERLREAMPQFPTLYMVEPKIMPILGDYDRRDLEAASAVGGQSHILISLLEVVAQAEINVSSLVWIVRSDQQLPYEKLEDSFLAHEALLRIKSAHIFFTTDYTSAENTGRLFMEFTKNLASLTLEVGECRSTYETGGSCDTSYCTDMVMYYIPRVRSLTLIRAVDFRRALTGYMNYAESTLQELHFRKVVEMGGSRPTTYLEFIRTIIKEVPNIQLKRWTILVPDTDVCGSRAFMDIAAKDCGVRASVQHHEPVDIMPWIRAEQRRMGHAIGH